MLFYPRSQISQRLERVVLLEPWIQAPKMDGLTKELFFQQLQHFCGCGTQSYKDPLLLILNNHAFCSEPAFSAEIMKKLSQFHLTPLTIDSHILLYFMNP
jgi:hypothetical protein